MATKIIPPGGFTLVGGNDQPDQNVPNQVSIALRLSNTVLDQIKKASSSNGVQLLTRGQGPMLRFGSRSLDLTLAPEKFANELFQYKSQNELVFTSSVTHRARLGTSTSQEPEADEAILALRNSIAMHEQEKKAHQTHVADALLPDPKNRWVAAKQQKKTSGLLAAGDRLPAARSPALAPTSQPAEGQSPRDRAMRKVVVHLLAVKSQSMNDIISKTCIPDQLLMQLLPALGQQVDGKWKLADRAYKELDIWRFKYPSSEERQAAIDHAVRAYDRMRLSKDDQLWQFLLPKSERGQGKVLSRLHLNPAASSGTPRVSSPIPHHDSQAVASDTGTPRVTPATTPVIGAAKKAGGDIMKRLLSKDPKKARAAEEAREKKRKEKENLDADQDARPNKRRSTAATKKSSDKIRSAEFVYSSEEDQPKEAAKVKAAGHSQERAKSEYVTATSEKNSQHNSLAKKTQTDHKATQSPSLQAKAKSTTGPTKAQLAKSPNQNHITASKQSNRPTVPSPLGAARPRQVSDVSDRSGIKLQRKTVEQPAGLGITTGLPRRRHDTVTSADSGEDASSEARSSKSSSTSSLSKNSPHDDMVSTRAAKARAANARATAKPTAIKSAPNKPAQKKDNGSSNNSMSSAAVKESSDERLDGGNSDSSISVVDTITFSQGVELAQKFQDSYYPAYAELYDAIAARQAKGETVSAEETNKLWRMHERLKQMKREIETASERRART